MFDFSDPNTATVWFPLNDGVMGGISSSRITQTAYGTALFTGEVSLANNGGFATVQANFRTPADFSPYSGLRLRVRGDGKAYAVYLSDRPRAILHQTDFTPLAGEWADILLPFRSFYPTYFGQRVYFTPALNLRRVRSISLLIEKKQAGVFALELAQIGLYSQSEVI
ncbi:MAG: CIA30 family protein [Anaerolineae bacterium]|jgi:monofunctional biosynthetic peptidoglycan transglycosylase|nr:CIA30 family protein [Anaerolineae bacterium]